jgi:hypothetical protein
VKYKRIDSAIHNFGRSFMSGMNYIDDDHVMYDVAAAVRRAPHELWINFSTGEIRPEGTYSPRLLESLALYQRALADHLRKHDVDPASVADVTLHHRLTHTGGESVMLARDDRGVDHRVAVRNK